MITAILRNRFIFGPPLLNDVIKPFDGLKHRVALQRLVMRFLPEERAAIMAFTPKAAGKYFIACFTKKYFPISLYENEYEYLWKLTAAIPLNLNGFDENSYEPGWRGLTGGQLLAETLCVKPSGEHPGDDENMCHIGRLSAARPGNRMTVLDEFEKIYKAEAAPLLKLIPEGGWTLAEIEQALATGRKTETFPGLLDRCRWIFRKTGNAWYDTPPQARILWTKENVAGYTKDWPGAQEIRKAFDSLDSWLGHDRAGRTAEIINHIRARVPKRLMEVFNGEKARR